MTGGRITRWTVGLLGALALAGCGGSGEITLPTALPSGSIALPSSLPSELPSATRTARPSLDPPSIAPPTPTRTTEPPTTESATGEPTSEPTTPTPTPTSTLTQAATSVPPTPATTSATPEQTSTNPTPTQTSQTPTPTDSPSPSDTQSQAPSASPSASASASAPGSASASAAPAEDSTNPLPLWLGLGALAAAAGALAWFLTMGSRRRAWDERLDVERAQCQWVADELVPALIDPATTPAHMSQHWATAQPTLDQIDANLAALVEEAPDDGRAMRARTMANATTLIRSSAGAHVALVVTGTTDQQARNASAAALQTARNQLTAALAPPA